MEIGNESIKTQPQGLLDLTHTEILKVSVNREYIQASSWRDILNHTLILARRDGHCSDLVDKRLSLGRVEGDRENGDHAYRIKAIDASIQPANANEAWRYIKQVARQTKLKLNIEFKWLDIPEASRRGCIGIIKVRGSEIAIYRTKS